MAIKNLLVLVILLGVLGVSVAHPKGLYLNYYKYRCPDAEAIVRRVTVQYVSHEPSLAAALLRMHFHDCFVRGCDGSILLKYPYNETERYAAPNLSINGPWWPVPLGRRDGRISRKSEVNLPSPLAGIAALKKKFFDKGAHTIGISHCSVIHQGIYNFTGKADSDSSMNPRYVRALKRRCNPADNRTIVMDPRSVKKFDSHYFNMVAQRKGLFKSDRTLLDDPETKSYIYTQVATAGSSFNKDFAHSMVKLGFVEILTGNKGEIRKRCAFVN
ncbi:hypothetical protein HID58_064050 [Brassica napus]|uniref:peroxidase n=1 Tax=Brassica napus TaxID=3708 RepID=A0ABQ7Z8V6_BRANA|nr:hypothetical protein HID58_064050 [Brassica napus]